jgi:hypothetical protein
MRTILVIMLCISVTGCAIPRNSANERKINELIVILRDQSVSDNIKRKKGAKIESYGKEAIPILIKNLEDKAVCFPKCRVKSLPRVPPSGMKTTYSMSVGRYCEGLLESIITHQNDPTYTRSKHMPYMWSVKDWNNWWQINQNKTLKQIQKEVMEYNIIELDREDL